MPIRSRVRRDSLVPLLTLAAAGAVLPPASLHFLGRQEVHLSSELHFAGVAGSAAIAFVAAVVLSIVGARRSDPRATLAGTAFSVMAALLTLHGIASPGIFVGMNGVVAFSGGATLPVGGALLALSALPAVRRTRNVGSLLWLQGVLLLLVAAVGTIGLLVPAAVPGVPESGSPLALTLLAIGGAFYGFLALKALRTFLLARRLADLTVLAGIGWLTAALIGALTLDYTELGWWLGHGFEVIGIALVGAPVAFDLFRHVPSRPLSGSLRGADLVSREEAFLGSDVRALTARVADKDASTDEHIRRVALLAVELGEELGLPAHRLRTLAIGALLHDVGKLGVPDSILKKPGPLDDGEFEVIRGHPRSGERLLRQLGFSHGVRRLVLHHHERLDGSGYPRRLDASRLDLDTRILAVCDVYDALISNRVYREAWSPQGALRLLRSEAGTRLDRRCVEGLERVLERLHGIRMPVAS